MPPGEVDLAVLTMAPVRGYSPSGRMSVAERLAAVNSRRR